MSALRSIKSQRRTATSVLSGDFDDRPSRDVLTSLLNGVPAYKEVEREEDSRKARKREKRERDKLRKREKREAAREARAAANAAGPSNASTSVDAYAHAPAANATRSGPAASSFWRARPAIHIPSAQRSQSETPPPLPASPRSTRGPSTESTYSRTSSKRPRTPSDATGFDISPEIASPTPPPMAAPPPRKKRPAVRKGWKGWVEGSPPPSDKLINLDQAVVLGERRTRSGKNFDAISVGKDSWV